VLYIIVKDILVYFIHIKNRSVGPSMLIIIRTAQSEKLTCMCVTLITYWSSADFGNCRLTRKRMGLLVRFLIANVFALSQRRGILSLILVVKLYPPVERHYTLFGWVSEKTWNIFNKSRMACLYLDIGPVNDDGGYMRPNTHRLCHIVISIIMNICLGLYLKMDSKRLVTPALHNDDNC